MKKRLRNEEQCTETGKVEIIIAICNALLAMDIFTSLTDGAGGRLEKPLAFECHNPYSISFDRIDNDKAHFLSPNYLDNIAFIPSFMNRPTNLVAIHGKDSCKYLREQIQSSNEIVISIQYMDECIRELTKFYAKKINRKHSIIYMATHAFIR